MDAPPASNAYALGHAQSELDRLIAQGHYVGQFTEHVLRSAGLAPGMRVLDVGCGAGDVSFLALRLVSPGGSVVGVDRSPESIAVARKRAAEAGLADVRFVASDLAALSLDQPVDAIIGRLVLMYFPEPGKVLRGLLRFLAPGGLVAFQELNTSTAQSQPRCELFEATGQRIERAFAASGASLRAGLELPATFREAGLPPPTLVQMGHVEHAPDGPGYQYLAGLTRSLLPLMERTGLATAAEVQVDTLADRLRAEVLGKQAVVAMPALVGGWARARPA